MSNCSPAVKEWRQTSGVVVLSNPLQSNPLSHRQIPSPLPTLYFPLPLSVPHSVLSDLTFIHTSHRISSLSFFSLFMSYKAIPAYDVHPCLSLTTSVSLNQASSKLCPQAYRKHIPTMQNKKNQVKGMTPSAYAQFIAQYLTFPVGTHLTIQTNTTAVFRSFKHIYSLHSKHSPITNLRQKRKQFVFHIENRCLTKMVIQRYNVINIKYFLFAKK